MPFRKTLRRGSLRRSDGHARHAARAGHSLQLTRCGNPVRGRLHRPCRTAPPLGDRRTIVGGADGRAVGGRDAAHAGQRGIGDTRAGLHRPCESVPPLCHCCLGPLRSREPTDGSARRDSRAGDRIQVARGGTRGTIDRLRGPRSTAPDVGHRLVRMAPANVDRPVEVVTDRDAGRHRRTRDGGEPALEGARRHRGREDGPPAGAPAFGKWELMTGRGLVRAGSETDRR